MHLKKLLFLFVIQFLPNCVTYDSSVQSARTLQKGQKQSSISFHYLFEHKIDVAQRRLKGDFGSDLDYRLPHPGFSYNQRFGVFSGSDMGLNLSLGVISFDQKFAIYADSLYAFSLAYKILLPTLYVDEWEDFSLQFSALNSIDVFSNLGLYVHPILMQGPKSQDRGMILGVHTGLMYGQSVGVFLEGSYYREKKGEELVSTEQIKLGLINGLDHNEKNERSKFFFTNQWVSVEMGAPMLGYAGMALAFNQDTKRRVSGSHFYWGAAAHFGVGLMPPELDQKYENIVSMRQVSCFGFFRKKNYLHKLALNRRQIAANVNTSKGWNRIVVDHYGLYTAFGQIFADFNLYWVGIHVPLSFLPRTSKFRDGGGASWDEPDKPLVQFADDHQKKLSFSFLQFEMVL